MNMAPVCPVHHKPMNDWPERWKCGVLIQTINGKKIYCSQKVEKNVAPVQPVAQAPKIQTSGVSLEAALLFVGLLYMGHPDKIDTALGQVEMVRELLS